MTSASSHPVEKTAPDAPSLAASTDSRATRAFERKVENLFTAAAEVFGVPRSVAAIYAVIFASPHPLCFADVEERLGLSKGSVSQGLRVLRKIGAIRTVDAQGAMREELCARSQAQSAEGEAQSALRLPLATLPQPPGAARREYFVPDMELRRLVARLLKEKVEPQLAGRGRQFDQLLQSVPFADPGEAAIVRGRLEHLQAWQRKARQIVPFAKTLLALGSDG